MNILTLRNEKVNLRQGPSFDYPVKIIYKKNISCNNSMMCQIILGKLEIMKITQAGYIFLSYQKKRLQL